MKILVCGGAGYIGSHFVKTAKKASHEIYVLDSLYSGHIASIIGVNFENIDIGNQSSLLDFLNKNSFDVVVHFCAHSIVSDSIASPQEYYINNVSSTLSLLEVMRKTNHDKLIFSSSASVYGIPCSSPITEDHPKNPINPYGWSKRIVEQIIEDYCHAYEFSAVCLRYFNVAGADPSGRIGEKHEPETHLIPNILKSIASNGDLMLKIFGNDYPTPDRTCIRDYIHVNDLASAHLLATDYLVENPGAHAFNLGIGRGFSVMEVINAAQSVTGKEVRFKVCDRRPGDPPILVADATLARRELGWKPEYTTIESIIETAWNWHKNGEVFS